MADNTRKSERAEARKQSDEIARLLALLGMDGHPIREDVTYRLDPEIELQALRDLAEGVPA